MYGNLVLNEWTITIGTKNLASLTEYIAAKGWRLRHHNYADSLQTTLRPGVLARIVPLIPYPHLHLPMERFVFVQTADDLGQRKPRRACIGGAAAGRSIFESMHFRCFTTPDCLLRNVWFVSICCRPTPGAITLRLRAISKPRPTQSQTGHLGLSGQISSPPRPRAVPPSGSP